MGLIVLLVLLWLLLFGLGSFGSLIHILIVAAVIILALRLIGAAGTGTRWYW